MRRLLGNLSNAESPCVPFPCFPITLFFNGKLKMLVPIVKLHMFKINCARNFTSAHFSLFSLFPLTLFPSWVSLVSKNYEIERTIVQLENEIYQIKQQHGEANKENIRQDF